MFKKLMLVLGALLVIGLTPVANTIAAPSDPCKGKRDERPASCGGEVTPGGEHNSLLITLGDDGSPGGEDQIKGDGSAVYSDSEKTVNAGLGGQTQPNKPGFSVSLKKAGRNPRHITTVLTCEKLDESVKGKGDGIDNCGNLPPSVTDDQMSLGLRPYESGCPTPLAGGECPDVFTMGAGPVLMSFRASYWNHNIFVEVASNIGGDGAPNPGRCLALLSEDQKNNFLGLCNEAKTNCNVGVTALDNGDTSSAGGGDGENDSWSVSAINVWALICGQLSGSETVYGVTTLSFDVDAIKD